MKSLVSQKLKLVAAAAASLSSLLISGTATAQNNLIDKDSAKAMGLSFEKILSNFEDAGAKTEQESVLLVGIYEEENTVDLQSLEGFVVRVPLDWIVAGYSDIPNNIKTR